MRSIFKLLLSAPRFSYPPANRPVRHLVNPIDNAYLTVNAYIFYTELRPTFYVGPKFKQVVSFFPNHFVYRIMKMI